MIHLLLADQVGMFRRRSGQDTDIAESVYKYPKGTDPSWLMPYEVSYSFQFTRWQHLFKHVIATVT